MRHGVDHRKLGRKPAAPQGAAAEPDECARSCRADRVGGYSKAKELRPLADRLITLGKAGTLHSRRRVFSLLTDKEATDKLFAIPGGAGSSAGTAATPGSSGPASGSEDGAEMAIIEYLPAEEKKAGGKKKKAAAKKAPAKTAVKKKEEKETSRPASKKMKTSAPKPTKPRSSRAQTQSAGRWSGVEDLFRNGGSESRKRPFGAVSHFGRTVPLPAIRLDQERKPKDMMKMDFIINKGRRPAR